MSKSLRNSLWNQWTVKALRCWHPTNHVLRKNPIAVEIGTTELRHSAMKKSCRESIRSFGRHDLLRCRHCRRRRCLCRRWDEFSVSNDSSTLHNSHWQRHCFCDALINNLRAYIISPQLCSKFWLLTVKYGMSAGLSVVGVIGWAVGNLYAYVIAYITRLSSLW